MNDAPADFLETMLGAIVGIELVVTSLVGKWKMSQNRPMADREGVASGIAREAGDARSRPRSRVQRAHEGSRSDRSDAGLPQR